MQGNNLPKQWSELDPNLVTSIQSAMVTLQFTLSPEGLDVNNYPSRLTLFIKEIRHLGLNWERLEGLTRRQGKSADILYTDPQLAALMDIEQVVSVLLKEMYPYFDAAKDAYEDLSNLDTGVDFDHSMIHLRDSMLTYLNNARNKARTLGDAERQDYLSAYTKFSNLIISFLTGVTEG